MTYINELQTLLKANLILWEYDNNDYNTIVMEWVEEYTTELLEEMEAMTGEEFNNLMTDTRLWLIELEERQQEEE